MSPGGGFPQGTGVLLINRPPLWKTCNCLSYNKVYSPSVTGKQAFPQSLPPGTAYRTLTKQIRCTDSGIGASHGGYQLPLKKISALPPGEPSNASGPSKADYNLSVVDYGRNLTCTSVRLEHRLQTTGVPLDINVLKWNAFLAIVLTGSHCIWSARFSVNNNASRHSPILAHQCLVS